MVKPKRVGVFVAMGLAGLAWANASLVLGAAQTEEIPGTRNPRTSATDVAAGAKTFRSHCASCHGVNGEGGRGPNLASGVFFHGSSDLDLLNNISDGIQGTEMPGLFYSSDRVWQIVAYIRSLSAGKEARPAADVVGGAKLFKTKGCQQCHRVNGEGGRLGPDLSDIGRIRSVEHLRAALVDPQADVRQRYWVVSFRDASGRSQEGFLMNEDSYTVQFMDMSERLHSVGKSALKDYKVEKTSKMPSLKDSLSSSELEQLVGYLSSLQPKRGAQ
jgi:cytochrome c oxidase cbb3-type subunit 3